MVSASKQDVIVSPDSFPVLSDGSLDNAARFVSLPTTEHKTASASDGMHFQIVYPNGGEVFYVGQKIVFRIWNDDQGYCAFTNAEISLSLTGGTSRCKIDPEMIPGQGEEWYTCVWTIPDSMPDGISTDSDQWCLSIACYDELDNNDKTDAVFTIRARPR